MGNSNSGIDTIERKNRAMIYTTGDGELGWAQLGGDSKAPASKDLCKIKSEAGEIAKGCVLVRRWGGGWKVEDQGRAQYSLAEAGVSSSWRKLSLLVKMRK